MSKFKYQGRSAETVKTRATMQGGDYDSYLDSKVRFMKVKEGNNTIRIMPPTWDTKGDWGDNWGIEVYIHRDIGPDKGAYICPDKMLGKACPICEARADADPDDEPLLKALKPGKQTLAYVIDRDQMNEGPMVWRTGIKGEKEIQSRSTDKKSGAIILIDDPEEGYDISFRRDGAGLKTTYTGWDIDRDPSPLHENERKQAAWLEFITDNPLPDMLIIHDYDYLDAIYRGKRSSKAERDDDASADRDAPSRSSRRGRDEPAGEEPDRRGPRGRDREEAVEDSRDARGSGRGRGSDFEDDRRAPRGEDREPESRSRSRREPEPKDDPEDEIPDDRQMAENTREGRHRGRDRDDDPKDEPKDEPRSRSRDPEPEDAPRSRSRDRDDPAPRGGGVDRAKESLQRLAPKKR